MQALIQEVLGSSSEGGQADSGPLQMMTKDQYANYVVQKMLEVCFGCAASWLADCSL